ncbi:MAG TPA: hypothetical protein VNP97_00655, partial [Microbacterium sp.]|nr:hypothetical protein [Microbacterium sp.]
MTLTALRDDALASADEGFVLRLGLPWIRSLPLASLEDLTISIDGETVAGMSIEIDGRQVDTAAFADEAGWWFLQDRLTIRGDRAVTSGAHEVAVAFRLMIPYLQAGPDGPLALPFRIERSLVVDAEASAYAVRDVALGDRAAEPRDATLPAEWTLAASAFNWTPDVIRAERTAPDIAVGIVAGGVAQVVELEPGQLWRSFPTTSDAELDALRTRLDGVGGSVSIVGASLDDWLSPTRRRTEAERLAFLLPQLRAAHRVGAAG